jgi:hypothetical protein
MTSEEVPEGGGLLGFSVGVLGVLLGLVLVGVLIGFVIEGVVVVGDEVVVVGEVVVGGVVVMSPGLDVTPPLFGGVVTSLLPPFPGFAGLVTLCAETLTAASATTSSNCSND